MLGRVIRKAKPEEAKVLSELALRSKGYWGYDAKFLDGCKEELCYDKNQLLSADYCFKVAQLNNHQIVGFFALNFLGKTQVELEALFIAPEFIGQGWGIQLLNSALQVAKDHQAKSILIQSDPFAEAFYLANGACKIGESESQSMPKRFLPLLEISL